MKLIFMQSRWVTMAKPPGMSQRPGRTHYILIDFLPLITTGKVGPGMFVMIHVILDARF